MTTNPQQSHGVPLPQIRNGKSPDGPYNGSLGFWLPDGPYGCLPLKLMKITFRVDEANRKIASAYAHWTRFFSSSAPDAYPRHHLDLESAVFSMRRVADELIALHFVLTNLEQEGRYPNHISIDRIGLLMKKETALDTDPYRGHREILRTLNDVNNAHKHSFIDTDLMMIGGQEPVVYALALDWNKLSSVPKFLDIPVRSLVNDFDLFYNATMTWLREWSKRNLPKAAA